MADRDKTGVALLSFAHLHQRKWAETFKKDSRVALIGLWDEDHSRGMKSAEEYDIPFFKDLDTLISGKEVQAAAICSENNRHIELTIKCCNRKIDVLCEKPVATTLEECRRMMQAVEESGIKYFQSSPQRLIPGNQTIKKLLDEGAIGRITHIRKRHGHGFLLSGLAKDMPWIVDSGRSGGGAYLDEGVHETDLLRYFFGDPLSVVCQIAGRSTLGVETSGAAIYRFPGELLAVLESGWNWLAGGPTTEIYGDRGTIIQSGTDCSSNTQGNFWPQLAIYRKEEGEWEEIDTYFNFADIHTLVPRAFIDSITDRIDPVSSIEDGFKALEMIIGAYRSAGAGRMIRFPLRKSSIRGKAL